MVMNYDGRRDILNILSLNPNIPEDWEIIDREYNAVGIEKVKIGANTYTNYGQFQFIWEKTYVTAPTRSSNGSMGMLNSLSTFLTPHLMLDFSIMSIDDYRSIMKQHYSQNEFVVECYDDIYNTIIKVKMYFATEQMPKLFTIAKKRLANDGSWEDFIMIAGVREYTVEMIGTNNDLELVSVTYHLNPPSQTGYGDQTIGEEDVYRGEEILMGGSATSFVQETFGGAYKFSKWNISPSGGETGNYINGYAYTINADLVLYAQWEETTDHILSFNYGLADPSIDESTYTYETSRTVVQGKSIGILPSVQTPKVKYKDIYGEEKEYEPYKNGMWYKTPIKVANSVAVSNNEPYWIDRDSIIYLLFDVAKYNLFLYVDGDLYQENTVATGNGIEYNTALNLPALVRRGYKLDGWYTSLTYGENTKWSGTLMPPDNLTLYARWVEENDNTNSDN